MMTSKQQENETCGYSVCWRCQFPLSSKNYCLRGCDDKECIPPLLWLETKDMNQADPTLRGLPTYKSKDGRIWPQPGADELEFLIRTAKNMALEAEAVRAADLANKFKNSEWYSEKEREVLEIAFSQYADEIRSRISEKGDGNG